MTDEAQNQYAKNHPIRELFERLQSNTSEFEHTHPTLDTRFLAVFQNRLSERFLELELQMQLNVKLTYFKFTRKPKKLDILTTQELVVVKSLQATLSESAESTEFLGDIKLPKFSTNDLFDLIAVGVHFDRLGDKLDEIKRLVVNDLNDNNTTTAVYHLLAEFISGSLAILIFALATKKDAFCYIKGGKHKFLNHEMIALRCSTKKLVLTFLLAIEGTDSAIWSDELEYLELLSGNGLHSQSIFSKKSSYQHIIFAFGEFPVTSGLLNLVERERCAAVVLTADAEAPRAIRPGIDEHSNLMTERARKQGEMTFRVSELGPIVVTHTGEVSPIGGVEMLSEAAGGSVLAEKTELVGNQNLGVIFDESLQNDFNQANIYAKTMEDLVASMQRGLMTDRNDMPSDKKFMEVKLKVLKDLSGIDTTPAALKFRRTARAFVRVDTLESSRYPRLETRYGNHRCSTSYFALTSAFTIQRSGRSNISFDNEAEKVLLETVMLRDVYMPRVIVDNQTVTFDRPVSFLEKAYGVVVMRNPCMLPAEWCFVPCYDTMRYGPPGMRIEPQNGIIPPGGVQLIKLKQTINVQVLRDPTCLTQQLVIHVMTGGDFVVKPNISYRRSCFGMPLDELVQLAQPVGRFAQTDSLNQQLNQSQNQQQLKQSHQQPQPQQQQQQQRQNGAQKQPPNHGPQAQPQQQAKQPGLQQIQDMFPKRNDQRAAATSDEATGTRSHLSQSHSAKYHFYSLPSRGGQSSPMFRFLIPKELKILVETARRSCLKKPDLFRRGGYHRDLQEIRWLLDNVESWNAESRISNVSAYSILEAIVLFFDCLPDSLFPSQLYSTIMDASKSFKNSLEIFNCLPEVNANIFVYLVTFLKLVHSHNSENDTDLPLFADTFADVLIKPPAALSLSQIPKSDRDSKRKFLGYFLANDVSHMFQIDLLLTRDEYPVLARHLAGIGSN